MKVSLDKLVLDIAEDGKVKYAWYITGFDKPIIEDEVWVGCASITFEGIPEVMDTNKINLDVFHPGLVAAIKAKE